MDVAVKLERLELFSTRCREGGLPITSQRRAVLEAVLSLENHPTADQVHERVIERLPELNRTTVYRALETLVAMDVITKISHPGRVVRFDRRTDKHHHLICMECEAVIDVDDADLDGVKIPDTSNLGFSVTDYRVQLRGLCHDCMRQEKVS